MKIKDNCILQNVTFSAMYRKILASMGPTGAGKSTFLKVNSGRQSIRTSEVEQRTV